MGGGRRLTCNSKDPRCVIFTLLKANTVIYITHFIVDCVC